MNPYDYTVEVTNRFKGLDLIDRVPEELWMEVHDIVQETVSKAIPMERNAKKQNGCLRLPNHFSRVQLCATPWTAAYQASLYMGFSRQKHWSGLPFPSPMHESGK